MVVNDLFKIKITDKIAADYDERRIQKFFGNSHRSGSSEIFLGKDILDLCTDTAAVTKMVFNDLRLEIKQHHDFGNADIDQFSHRMFHHGNIADGQHRFGHRVCQRLYPGPETACHHHCFDIFSHGLSFLKFND